MKTLLLIVLLMALPLAAFSQEGDTLSVRAHTPSWGWSVLANPGQVLAIDEYVQKWLKHKSTFSIGAELNHVYLPSDSNAFASDYGYPTLSLGLRYAFNGAVRMHRDPDPDWGLAEEVDYDSHLGNTLSLYFLFTRPLLRSRHWEADYALGAGLGYSGLIYNRDDDIDNELIGSHLLIFFDAGLHLTYHPVPEWGIRIGIDFTHHSNGALTRPNKGTNTVGPSIGLVYTPYYETLVRERHVRYNPPFARRWQVDIAAGVGAKALVEDWNETQFRTPSTESDYRTDHFHLYMAYSLQVSVMYRYARRWASGVGLDLFYGDYAWRTEELDEADGYDLKHSPWSLGLAAKHEVFFGRFSLPMEVGYYLYRHMGHSAEEIETPYYERIGVHYHFPSLGGLSVGFNLKAHALKADFTEVCVRMPIVK